MPAARQQRAFALPILLFILFAAGIAFANATLRSAGLLSLQSQQQTAKVLALARDAMLARAAWEDASPGSLSCPDEDGDGSVDNCAGALYVGRFPWEKYGLEAPRDGAGECLWYAITPGARSTSLQVHHRGRFGTQPAINSTWHGEGLKPSDPKLVVVERDRPQPVERSAIAVLIAPGPPLAGQARSAGEPCRGGKAANFLESLLTADGTRISVGAPSATNNDTVLVIDSLGQATQARALLELAPALTQLLQQPGFDAASLVQDQHLYLPFQDSAVINAFATATTGSANTADHPECTSYSPGNYAIEWLCFNEWPAQIRVAELVAPQAGSAGRLGLVLGTWSLQVSTDAAPLLSRNDPP